MSELKLISPLLDGLEIVKCVQSGGGTSVYLLRSAHTGQQYILKHISVPESQTQVDALLFTGAAADEAAAQAYYEQVVNDYRTNSPIWSCCAAAQISPPIWTTRSVQKKKALVLSSTCCQKNGRRWWNI